MQAFKRLVGKLTSLKPADIREIIVVIIMLFITIALSIPEYIKDKEMAAEQKETLRINRNVDETSN